MKNISFIIVVLLVMMASISCKKELDIVPHKIYYDNFYQTEDDAIAAVNAVYDMLGSVNQYSNYLWLIQDIGSDDCNARATINDPNLQEFNSYNIRPTNSFVSGIWQGTYLGISRANVVIEKVPAIKMETVTKERIIAEAKFLRALFYFNLVRIYGEVPLITVPVTPNLGDEEIYLSKSSVSAIYNQIIADLSQAAEKLPAKYSSTNDLGRATSGAALGLLSKVYLTNKDWENAQLTAAKVIDSKIYGLNADYASNFKEANKNGKESVFEVQFYKKVNSECSQMVISGLPSIPGLFSSGTETMLPTTDLLNSFENGDHRKEVTFFDNYFGGLYKFEPHIWKYWDQVAYKPATTSASGADFFVMRYSEILLIYAEALNEAKGGPTADAYTAINLVRARARNGKTGILPDLDGLDQLTFRSAVLSERRHEFVNEGQRWYDLVRTGNLVEFVKRAKGDNTNPTAFSYLFPIPQRELDNNKNLKQNDGY